MRVYVWNAPRQAKAKRRLDRLFSQYVLTRDQRRCQWCGRTHDRDGKALHIDCSHIIPREVLSVRWTPVNALALCFSCHKSDGLRRWHSSPLMAARWVRSRLGDEACNALLTVAEAPYDFTREEYVRLDHLLIDLLAGLGVSTPTTYADGQKVNEFAFKRLCQKAAQKLARRLKRGYCSHIP